MRNQPTLTSVRRTPLGLVPVLGMSLLLSPVAVAADLDTENQQLREQNRELQAELAANKAGGKEASGDATAKVRLFTGKSLGNWLTRDKDAKKNWKLANVVELDPSDPKKLVGHGEGQGEDGVMVLEKSAGGADIYTAREYGDGHYHVEFLVPRGSNSGIYLMGLYEVQVLDSHGKKKEDLRPGDLGGIYNTKPPAMNAAKAPGEWQAFDIEFRAPRFDASGKKTENARFVRVVLNGQVIHENVEAPKPTGGELPGGEKKSAGPLMFQGDHGPVAFRHVWVIPTNPAQGHADGGGGERGEKRKAEEGER